MNRTNIQQKLQPNRKSEKITATPNIEYFATNFTLNNCIDSSPMNSNEYIQTVVHKLKETE